MKFKSSFIYGYTLLTIGSWVVVHNSHPTDAGMPMYQVPLHSTATVIEDHSPETEELSFFTPRETATYSVSGMAIAVQSK